MRIDFSTVVHERLQALNKTSSLELCFVSCGQFIDLGERTSAGIDLVETIIRYSMGELSAYNDIIEVRVNYSSDFVEVLVADTGNGLKPDSPLFELFHRSGMRPLSSPNFENSLIKRAHELEFESGAKIWVESKWKMGTVFHIEFPLQDISPENAEKSRRS